MSGYSVSPSIKKHALAPVRQIPGIKKSVRVLFYLFTLYIVLPLIDVPLLGLSLSAPIMFLIALETFFRPPFAQLSRCRRWVLFALCIWFGIFLSALLNGVLSGGTDFDSDGLIWIIRYAYWLLVFVITAYLISEGELWPIINRLLAWGVLALAIMRWIEVLLYGNLGAWTRTHLISQNTYGLLFSTFSPFLFTWLLEVRGSQRWLATAANLILWAAAAINGSRGSWVAIAIMVVVQLLLFLSVHPRSTIPLAIVLLFAAGLGMLVLSTTNLVSNAVESRFSTFNNLEQDKSYQIRKLMNQKSMRLFAESPIIGVGASRFRKESVPLDIPFVLSYAGQEHFDVKSSHNSYLGFLAETGLAGAIPYGLLLISLTVRGSLSALRLVRRGQFWPAAVLGTFVGMSIHMWAINSLTGSSTWFVYGLVAAMIVTASRARKNKQTT